MSEKRIQIPEGIFSEIATGDPHAFEELYKLTYRGMYAFCLNLTKDKDDAEDLMQDSYIRIRNASHLYKEQGNPMGWMMKITKNLYLMKLRKEKNKTTVDIDDYENDPKLGFEQISDSDNRMLLEELFLHLKDADKEIVILHGLNDMTFQEIADMQGKPLGTILTKYNRAIKKLNLIVTKEGRSKI